MHLWFSASIRRILKNYIFFSPRTDQTLKVDVLTQFSSKLSNFLGGVLDIIVAKHTKRGKLSEILCVFWYTLLDNVWMLRFSQAPRAKNITNNCKNSTQQFFHMSERTHVPRRPCFKSHQNCSKINFSSFICSSLVWHILPPSFGCRYLWLGGRRSIRRALPIFLQKQNWLLFTCTSNSDVQLLHYCCSGIFGSIFALFAFTRLHQCNAQTPAYNHSAKQWLPSYWSYLEKIYNKASHWRS